MIEIRGDKKGIDWYFVYFAKNTSEFAKERHKNDRQTGTFFLNFCSK